MTRKRGPLLGVGTSFLIWGGSGRGSKKTFRPYIRFSNPESPLAERPSYQLVGSIAEDTSLTRIGRVGHRVVARDCSCGVTAVRRRSRVTHPPVDVEFWSRSRVTQAFVECPERDQGPKIAPGMQKRQNFRNFASQKSKIFGVSCKIFGAVGLSNWLKGSRVTPPVDMNEMPGGAALRRKKFEQGEDEPGLNTPFADRMPNTSLASITAIRI
ncbi:hypothetical protein DFH09DRAFT_1468299 [Mycena vulgaris]|nr:hypothetical protein DFH09DRAFT_1468299 [Mycena vulgaris]